jgi:protein-L-isoaspartate(D-aspartate) O-methyltransferase
LIATIQAEARATAHITGRDALSANVLAAIRKVPRHRFLPGSLTRRAYDDTALPIGSGQTISQPFIVALMTDLLDLHPDDNVLEIGTGSGYQTAILAELSRRVCSIEVIPALAEKAARTLGREGYGAVALRCGSGRVGWPERAPFDAIVVTAAARQVPTDLIGQLGADGRMVIPVGEPFADQELILVQKHIDGSTSSRTVLPVAFVPLTGN